MTDEQRYRVALTSVALMAEVKRTSLLGKMTAEGKEQADAYERVILLLTAEADATRAAQPPRVDTDKSPPGDVLR